MTSNVKTHYGEYSHEAGYYPHSTPIQAIWAIAGSIDELIEGSSAEDYQPSLSSSARYITGDKEGLIGIWRVMRNKHGELRLRIVSLLDVSSLSPSPLSSSVRSVTEREGTLLIGTSSSEILEVLDDNIPPLEAAFIALRRKNATLAALTALPPAIDAFTPTARAVPIPPSYSELDTTKANASVANSSNNIKNTADSTLRSAAVSGSRSTTSAPSKKDSTVSTAKYTVPALRLASGHYQGELWGLAMHPHLPLYMTCGDDGLLCCWSLVQHKLLSYVKLPEKLRAIDIIPTDGSEVAVALNSGAVWVLQTRLLLNPRNVPQTEVDQTLCAFELQLSEEVLRAARSLSHAIPSTSQLSPSLSAPPATINIAPSAAIGLPAAADSTVTVTPVAPTATSPPATTTTPAVVTAILASFSAPKDTRGSRPDVRILVRGATQWVQEVKYSFEGSVLAVGSHDTNIYIYDVTHEYALQPLQPLQPEALRKAVNTSSSLPGLSEAKKSNVKHVHPVTHLDFGVILTSRANKIMTYDEISRTVVTSELLAEASLGSGSKVPDVSLLAPLDEKNRKGKNEENDRSEKGDMSGREVKGMKSREPKWVVTSTRDLSRSDICIQSTCGGGDLLYWRMDGSAISSPEVVKVRVGCVTDATAGDLAVMTLTLFGRTLLMTDIGDIKDFCNTRFQGASNTHKLLCPHLTILPNHKHFFTPFPFFPLPCLLSLLGRLVGLVVAARWLARAGALRTLRLSIFLFLFSSTVQ